MRWYAKVAISCYLSEANLNSYNAHPSSDQLKACSDMLSGALSGSNSVFSNVVPSSGNPLAAINTTVLYFKHSSAVCKILTASFEVVVS